MKKVKLDESAYISWKNFQHTFKATSEEVIVMYSEKLKVKYMKEDVWNSFFHKLVFSASRIFIID